jgi:hypothetical protein
MIPSCRYVVVLTAYLVIFGCTPVQSEETPVKTLANPSSATTEADTLRRLAAMGDCCSYLDDIYKLYSTTKSNKVRIASLYRLGVCGHIGPYEDLRDGRLKEGYTRVEVLQYLLRLRPELKKRGLAVAIRDKDVSVAEAACREVYSRDIDGVDGAEKYCSRFPAAVHTRPPTVMRPGGPTVP